MRIATTRSCLDEAGYVKLRKYNGDKECMEHRAASLLAGKAAVELVYGKNDVSSESEIGSAMGVVRRLIDGCCVKTSLEMEKYYWCAKKLLIKNRKLLDVMVNKLIEKEILLSGGIQKLMMIE